MAPPPAPDAPGPAGLGAVSVALPPAIAPLPPDVARALVRLERAAEGGGLLRRLIVGPLEEALAEGEAALAEARAHAAALATAGQALLAAMGRAWIEAGAPGRPAVATSLEWRLEQEREAWLERLGALRGRREQIRDTFAAADDQADAERKRLDALLARLTARVEYVEAATETLESEGIFRAVDMLAELPDELVSGLPRDDVGRCRAFLIRLRTRLLDELDEANLARERVSTRRMRTLRQGLQADTRVLDQAAALEAARAQSREQVDRFLVDVGRKLAPACASFANGSDVCAALRDLQVRLEEAREIAAALDDLLAAARG